RPRTRHHARDPRRLPTRSARRRMAPSPRALQGRPSRRPIRRRRAPHPPRHRRRHDRMTRQPTITDDDIFALLGAAAEYDGRRVATADLNTWQQAANRAHWTYDDALDAIHEHYTHHTEWIRPAHITQQIRRHRAQPPKAELPALPGAHAHPDHRDRIATWARQQLQLD